MRTISGGAAERLHHRSTDTPGSTASFGQGRRPANVGNGRTCSGCPSPTTSASSSSTSTPVSSRRVTTATFSKFLTAIPCPCPPSTSGCSTTPWPSGWITTPRVTFWHASRSPTLPPSGSSAGRGLRRRQEEIARIEAKTGHLRNFQAAVVPGLLQTPNYARKMFEEVGLDTRAQDVSRALAVRLDRQAILHDPDRRLGFVITEAVLLWPRGEIPEMLAQLDRLQAVSELPTVDLALLPLGLSPPYSPINSFDIYDDKLVLIETLTEQLAVRDSSDLAMYLKAYEAFRESALS